MLTFEPLSLSGAYRIRMSLLADDRGFFARRFCADTFRHHGLETNFVQRSISYSERRGTLRGLHFQALPALETKIVRCTRGAAFDVIVDLRKNAATYGKWHSEEITAENRVILYVPKGFAHGFQTLREGTELDYEITPNYSPRRVRGVRFDDPTLGIPWPIVNPIVSTSDRNLPILSDLGEVARDDSAQSHE